MGGGINGAYAPPSIRDMLPTMSNDEETPMSIATITITPPARWKARNPVFVEAVPTAPAGCYAALYLLDGSTPEYGVALVNFDGQSYAGNVYGDEATARRYMESQREAL